MPDRAFLGPLITSRSNARVKALRASLTGSASEPGDLLGLEGAHLLEEAHKSGLSFETVFLREGSESILGQDGGWRHALHTRHWALLSRDVFDSAVTTESPQGIAATWNIQEADPTKLGSGALVLEDLQDPGNLGTLLRSCDAFSVRRVLATPATVNQWNPKVVRAASGSAFRTRVQRMPLEEIVATLRSEGVRIFAAVVCFGSGAKVGEPVLAAPHGVLTGRVANALAPEGERYRNLPFGDATSGYAASFAGDTDFLDPFAIVIGNEGAGLSNKAKELADEQVMIPCSVESLNAAIAGSILLYEAHRQTLLRAWARRQGLRP